MGPTWLIGHFLLMDMSLLTKGGLQVLLNTLSIISTQILNAWKLFKYVHPSFMRS